MIIKHLFLVAIVKGNFKEEVYFNWTLKNMPHFDESK